MLYYHSSSSLLSELSDDRKAKQIVFYFFLIWWIYGYIAIKKEKRIRKFIALITIYLLIFKEFIHKEKGEI